MSDIVERLVDLHKQATEERSHFYTGKCICDAIAEITRLREALEDIRVHAHTLSTWSVSKDVQEGIQAIHAAAIRARATP